MIETEFVKAIDAALECFTKLCFSFFVAQSPVIGLLCGRGNQKLWMGRKTK
jgi:hypothetical protein